MYRKIAAVAGSLLLLGVLIAPAVMASVPKVVVFEEFGATW